jgi:hypothetical protein
VSLFKRKPSKENATPMTRYREIKKREKRVDGKEVCTYQGRWSGKQSGVLKIGYKGFVARQCEGKSIGSKAGESLKTTPIVSGFQIPIGRVVDR